MNELMIRLEPGGKKTYYQQIYEYIVQAIHQGILSSHEKLPSTRALAQQLQISRSTVDSAYAQLVSEGYLRSQPGSGYYVEDVSLLCQMGMLEKKVAFPKKEKRKPEETKRIDFSPKGIDLAHFPFGIWRKISKELLSADNASLFQAGEAKGDVQLRRITAQYLFEARGVHCREDQIIFGAGFEYLFLLLSQILGEGKGPVVAMEDPSYLQAYEMFRELKFPVHRIPMDHQGLLVREIPLKTDLCYVMPSHQFPAGTVMGVNRRMELLQWAGEQENRFILEDDYDSEFRYEGRPIPALQGLDQKGKVIYLGTFSRSIAPALRMSYMVLPDQLLQVYEQRQGFLANTVSRLDQQMVCRFLEGGFYQRHLNRMRTVYCGKRALLLKELEGLKYPYEVEGENAGMHLIVDVRNHMAEQELVQRAEEAGVRVYPFSAYQLRKNTGETKILLGYASLDQEEIRRGIHLLVEAWNRSE